MNCVEWKRLTGINLKKRKILFKKEKMILSKSKEFKVFYIYIKYFQ